MFTNRFKFSLQLLISSILFLGGCGIWEDFTTYFNLYYNTADIYNKAEEQILAQQEEMFSTEPPTISGNVNTDLIKVIEKCSNILQFSSETAYVEDALMMLGKSFYYQRNYQKAERKFNELKAAHPESDFLLEANLWIAKCKMRLKNYVSGLSKLNEVRAIAIEEDEQEIIRDAYVEEIVYRKTTEDYPGAIELANEFLEVSDDDEIKAEVWYEVGNLNLKIQDVQNAIIAYQNVFEYSPDFDLDVDAKLKLGRALREGGESERSLLLFEDMLDEDKYEENYEQIEFEIGKTLGSLGRYDEALDQLTKVDTVYKGTKSSGAANFEKGLLYENNMKNLDSAAVYYRKASSSSLPEDYISRAREKNLLFTRYVGLSKSLKDYNLQIYYLQNPEEFVKDSIEYVEDSLAIAEEIANIQELQAIWAGLDSMFNVTDTTGFYQDTIKVIDTLLVQIDTLETEPITLTRDSVLVKLREPQIEDSSIVTRFDTLFANREMDPFQQKLLQQKKIEQEQRTRQLAAELPDTLKFANNPPVRPGLPIDSIRTLLAKYQLDLGNLFLAELNIPDSAYKYYNSNLSDYPNTTYQANTLYALGSYYLTVDEKRRADSLFSVIYEDYRNESIVNAAADKLGKPYIDLDYDPAKERFAEAEAVMLSGNYDEAVSVYYNIFKMFPLSDYSAKALYTCGWVMENELLLLDSASVYYDSLAANYPASEYVKLIAPKLSFYKQHKRQQELAVIDSLNMLEKTSIDSLPSDSLIVQEDLETPGDTVQVAIGEEKLTAREEKISKEPVVPVTKEPVWNPRRKR